MDSLKKRTPDYTDVAYREAVARLRYLLAESYSPQATPTKIPHVHMTKVDDSGDETDASVVMSERSRTSRQVSYRTPYFGSKRALYTDSLPKLSHAGSLLNVPGAPDITESGPKTEGQQPPPELMAFIERQEEYIEQLEKESQYCREELSHLLSKVKDVISENEGLHEKEKSGLLKSVFDCFESGDDEDQDMEHEKSEKKKSQPSKKKRLEGPTIVFESRISELEAQLTQTKIDLRKAQEEAEIYKKKLTDSNPQSFEMSGVPHADSYRQQIETLQREKEELAENLSKLSSAVTQIREKESDASHKVKRSLDLVDQAQFEKAQAEMEVRRLKDELDRQHDKLRDMLQEQGRRVQDERAQAERRYAQQVEQLSADLTAQWDAASKLQLELEKQRRTDTELRRELQQKIATIEELKKELQTKIAGLQSEATQSAAERGSLEQELAANRLTAERADRELRQESSRLQAEVTALRQRLDRADSDLLHSRRENIRLSDQMAALEREVNLAKMMKDSSDKGPSESANLSSPSKQAREKELSSMILDMEAKHVRTVAELESMIQSQKKIVDKLTDECHSLTQKLEDSSAQHKEEKTILREEKAVLMGKLEQVWTNCKELGVVNDGLSSSGAEEQTTPMLRGVIQDPSMALKHSLNHSRSMIHKQAMNHSPKLDMNPSQSISHKDMNPSQNLSRNQNFSLSQDMNPSQNFSHKDMNPSQNLSHNQNFSLSQDMNPIQNFSLSQNMNPNQNFSLRQDMNPSHKDMSRSQNFSRNLNMTPNQNFSLSQTMSPNQISSLKENMTHSWTSINNPKSIRNKELSLNQDTVHRLGSDLNQDWNPNQVLDQYNPNTPNSDVSKALSFNKALGLNPSLNHSQDLGVNQVMNLNLVSDPKQMLRPSQCKNQSRLSLGHPPLSSRRREVDQPPLTLEDLATDSDSNDSQSAQLQIFR